MTKLGERIKKIRGKMTQKEFSEILGITQRAVINYEISGRVPRKKILNSICERFGICEQWLLTGEGPMRANADKREGRTCDTVAGESSVSSVQPIENTQSQSNKTCDMSQVSPSIRKNMELQERLLAAHERLLSLTEQNAELRLQLERRDMRIHELEKENAGLREAQKGAAAVFRAAAGDAG
ncbi:MAG TPA: helix-turn-helix domain-containing protein [Candidatus Mailhella merdavium]|nr:helix-turn-helix domain-containing protein [Candidatus Mailhella merdavium]